MRNMYLSMESLYTVEEDLLGTGFSIPNITSEDLSNLIAHAKTIVGNDKIKEIEAFVLTDESSLYERLAPKRLSIRFIAENMKSFYLAFPGLIRIENYKPSTQAENKRALEGMKLFIYRDIMNATRLHFTLTNDGEKLGLDENILKLIKSNIKSLGETVEFKVGFESRYLAALKFNEELSFEKERLKFEVKNELEAMINFEIPEIASNSGLKYQQDALKRKYIEVIEPNFL